MPPTEISENDPPQRPETPQQPPPKRRRVSQAFRIPDLPGPPPVNRGLRAETVAPLSSARHPDRPDMPGLRAASEAPTVHSSAMRPLGLLPARNTVHIVTQKSTKGASGSSGASGTRPGPSQQTRDDVAALKDTVAELREEVTKYRKELTDVRKQVTDHERDRVEEANQTAEDFATLNKSVETLHTLWEKDHERLEDLAVAIEDAPVGERRDVDGSNAAAPAVRSIDIANVVRLAIHYYIGLSHSSSEVPEPLVSGWWTPPDANGIAHLRPSWDDGFGPNAAGWMADVIQRILATGHQFTQNLTPAEIASVPHIRWTQAVRQCWESLKTRRDLQSSPEKQLKIRTSSKTNGRRTLKAKARSSARKYMPEFHGKHWDFLCERRNQSPDFDPPPGPAPPQPPVDNPAVDVNTDEEGGGGGEDAQLPTRGEDRVDPHAHWISRAPEWRRPELQQVYDEMDVVIVKHKIPHHPRVRGPILPQDKLPSTTQGRKSSGDVSVLALIPRCWVRSEWLDVRPNQVQRMVDIAAELFAPYLAPPEISGPPLAREAQRVNAEAGPSGTARTPSVERDDGMEEAEEMEEMEEGDNEGEDVVDYE